MFNEYELLTISPLYDINKREWKKLFSKIGHSGDLGPLDPSEKEVP